MSNYTLTIVDTTGIQDYIFGTNHLKQNIAASYLVACATRQWVVDSLDCLQLTHNVNDLDDTTGPLTDQKIEDGELQVELLYAGGGNAVLLFTDGCDAVKLAKLLTRRTLLDAPGLKVVLAHQEFDWQNDPLGGENGIIQQTFKKLALRKANRTTSSPILGLGVTAACVYSGLPSIDIDKEGDRLISAQVKAKLDQVENANQRLKELIDFGEYEPAMDFDDFGRTEDESSYIAVIHADGNRMGQRIQDILDDFSDPSEGNRKCIEQLRAFSLSVQLAAIKAAQKTVDRVIDSIEIKQDKNIERKVIGEQIELRANKLPFRPLVFGGDDTTFVCDGRLGLHLTAYYLQQLSNYELTDGELMYCRAGIAIVHTHFPFSRAYALSEELAKSAKDYIKERQEEEEEDGLSAMDWHFASSGFILDLQEVREREYKVSDGNLLIRPVRITEPEEDWRSWPLFCKLVEAFRNGKDWIERHNKVLTLREVLRDGPIAVEHFLTIYGGHKLPVIEPQPDMEIQGWQGERCGYFDAIEAMDFFVALKEEVKVEE